MGWLRLAQTCITGQWSKGMCILVTEIEYIDDIGHYLVCWQVDGCVHWQVAFTTTRPKDMSMPAMTDSSKA